MRIELLHVIVRRFRRFILEDILGIGHWMNGYYPHLFYLVREDLDLPGHLLSYDYLEKHLGHCERDTILYKPDVMTCPEKIYMYEDTHIYGFAKFIISPKGNDGRFIMKKHAGASQGLTVITGKHGQEVGRLSSGLVYSRERDVDTDVIVNEDVRIGANVTLLPGIIIGRGSVIGACSVVTKDVPPYTIAAGNPAKVISYVFSPEEIQKHEEILYPKEERLDLDVIRKQYDYFYHHH